MIHGSVKQQNCGFCLSRGQPNQSCHFVQWFHCTRHFYQRKYVLDTLSRKPVKHKSRGSMVFKDSCRVQDVKNEGNYTFVFFRGIEMKTEKLARSTNKQIRHTSSTFNFHHTKHLAPLVEKKLPLRRSIDRNVLSFKKKKNYPQNKKSLHKSRSHPLQRSNIHRRKTLKKKEKNVDQKKRDTFDFTRYPP